MTLNRRREHTYLTTYYTLIPHLDQTIHQNNNRAFDSLRKFGRHSDRVRHSLLSTSVKASLLDQSLRRSRVEDQVQQCQYQKDLALTSEKAITRNQIQFNQSQTKRNERLARDIRVRRKLEGRLELMAEAARDRLISVRRW